MSNTKSLFFDGVTYSAADMVAYLAGLTSDGVLMDASNSMLSTLTTEGNIHISGGTAYIQGYCYILGSDGAEIAPGEGITSALLVLQLDKVNKKFSIALKENQTEAAANEIPLAAYSVTSGTASLADKRKAVVFKIQAAANDNKITYATGTSETLSTGADARVMTVTLPGGDYKYHEVTFICNGYRSTITYFTQTGDILVISESFTGQYSNVIDVKINTDKSFKHIDPDGKGLLMAVRYESGKLIITGRLLKYTSTFTVNSFAKVISIR